MGGIAVSLTCELEKFLLGLLREVYGIATASQFSEYLQDVFLVLSRLHATLRQV